MLILRPDLASKDAKKPEDVLKKLLTGTTYTVKNSTLIGKKRLAYPIKKFVEGIYVQYDLTAEALHAADIEKQVTLGNDVVRFLLQRKAE